MTLEQIANTIHRIKDCQDDPERGHALEDALREEFIQYVAHNADGLLAEMARLVLTTSEIDFARWYA